LIKLVERTAELATIRALLGRGGLLVVEGGAGVDKTALLDTACAIAAQKRRMVLRARGSDLECDFAFGIVRQLFERYSAGASKEERAALFARLGSRGTGTAPAWAFAPDGKRYIFFNVAQALLAYGESGVTRPSFDCSR
jgi:hypothetical protein